MIMSRGPRARQRGGFALGLVVGLLLGLAIALGVALYVTKTPMQLMLKGQQRTPEQDAAEAERNKNWDPNAALAGRPVVRPEAPSAPGAQAAAPLSASGPQLPTSADNGHVVPLSAPASAAAPHSNRDAAAILNGQADAPPAAAAADPFVYFVQVGAYGRAEDAEQQRARLALAGLNPVVSEREQNGHPVHRVRLGPFEKKEDADAQLDRAKATDPDATLVRVERNHP